MERFCITQKRPTQKSANAKLAKKKLVMERRRRDRVTTNITSRLPASSRRSRLRITDIKMSIKFLQQLQNKSRSQLGDIKNVNKIFWQAWRQAQLLDKLSFHSSSRKFYSMPGCVHWGQ